MMNHKLTKLTCAVMTAVLALSLTACAAKSDSYIVTDNGFAETTRAAYNEKKEAGFYDYSADMEAVAEEAEFEYAEDGPVAEAPEETDAEAGIDPSGRPEKLVYTCSIEMESTEFEKSVDGIKALIVKYNGFIEQEHRSDDAYGWYYENYIKTSGTLHEFLTVRIPSEHYDDFVNALGDSGKITDKSQNVQNISKRYYETETTIQSLKIQEERLLDMMESAQTIEEMITVEARLSEVQNQLAIYKNELSDMDTDVSYSTVTITLNEVLEYTPDREPVKTATFGDRLKNTLSDSWNGFLDFQEDFLFFLIGAFPYLLILAVIIVVIVLLTKKNRKNKAEKKAAKKTLPETNAPESRE